MTPEEYRTKKKRLVSFLIAIVMIAGAFGTLFIINDNLSVRGAENWADNSYLYRRLVTIDHDKVNQTLSDFPVPVVMSDDSVMYDDVQEDGDDIVFYDYYDNTTLLDFEHDYWDKGGGVINSVWHVNLSTVYSDVDTYMWMYYGNNTASDVSDAENTWDINYNLVYHFSESSGNILDSTSHDNDSTVTGTLDYQQDGAGLLRLGTKRPKRGRGRPRKSGRRGN